MKIRKAQGAENAKHGQAVSILGGCPSAILIQQCHGLKMEDDT